MKQRVSVQATKKQVPLIFEIIDLINSKYLFSRKSHDVVSGMIGVDRAPDGVVLVKRKRSGRRSVRIPAID